MLIIYRSCDLTPLGNLLWAYVESLVYKNNSQPILELKDEKESELGQYVIKNFN